MKRASGSKKRNDVIPVVVGGILAALLASGCVSSNALGSDRMRAQGATAPLDEKATIPLERIEPVVVAPEPPESVRALSERAVRRLAKARELVTEQRFTEASIELERAMRYEPNHPQIHAALAELHWQARNIERAKEHARRAIEADPSVTVPHYVLGRCHLERGDRVDAIASLKVALLCLDFEGDPETAALSRYYLGTALAQEGYVTAALTQLEGFENLTRGMTSGAGASDLKLLLQTGRTPLAQTKSELLEKLSRYADAAEALRGIVDDGGASVPTTVRLARLLLLAGQTDDALSTVRRIDSDDAQVVDLLFEIHERRGTPEKTLDDLRSRMAQRPDSAAVSRSLIDVYVRLERPGDAMTELLRHLDQFPADEAARLQLIGLHLQEERWSEALAVCATAIVQSVDQMPDCIDYIVERAGAAAQRVAVGDPADPSLAEVDHAEAFLRAQVAEASGRPEAALAWLERSYAHQPKLIATRAALAKCYLDRFRYDDARRVVARTDEAVPQDAALERLLGLVYERLDDLARAEVHLRAATQLDRADAASMFELAKVYRRQGKSNQAQRQLRVLLVAQPQHERARELLAVLYMRERKGKEAFEQIEALKRNSNKPTTIARCETLLNAELRADVERLRQHLLDAMDASEPDAATWVAIGETYADFEPHKQRQAYAKALELDPANEEAAWELVKATRRDLDFEGAADQLRLMLKRRPNRHSWHKELIDLLITLQRYDDAISYTDQQLERPNVDADTARDYRVRVLRALQGAQRKDEVIRRLATWADAEPDNERWRRWLADEYERQEKAALAVPIREALYHDNPDDWSALGGVAAALAGDDRHDRAMQFVLDRMNIDPEADEAMLMLASLLADADRLDEAIELIHTKLRETTQRTRFQNLLLAQLQEAERYDEAIDYVEALHDEAVVLLGAMRDGRRRGRNERGGMRRRVLQPDESTTGQDLHQRVLELRQRMALILIGAKRYVEARNQLDDWLEGSADPAFKSAALRLLAFCYRAEGNEDRATDIMAQVLADAPTDVLLNNDVAYAWIDKGVRLEEAERMIRYALGSRPQQGAYLDTYGWLRYKKGDFEGAIKWLNRSRASATGNDPVVHDHLGDAYWRAGRKAEAVEMWTKASELTSERDEDRPISADERRVKETAQGKIDAADERQEPGIAPLAAPHEQADHKANEAGDDS